MTRIIIKTEKGPKELKVGDKTVAICMCGLTTDPTGLCTGKHKATSDEKEGVIYMYDEKLNREEVGSMETDKDGKQKCSCGGNCNCNN